MRTLRTSLLMLVAMTLLTGLIYPLVVTGIAQVAFPSAANGSLIDHGGRAVGSALVGQSFSGARYFWGRPSSTSYNAASSAGSNLGPTNPALVERVEKDVERLRAAHPGVAGQVPGDLVTTSASGIDPAISPAAAYFQVGRVAESRGVSPEALRRLVEQHIEGRGLGFLGEPSVNVLVLNLALDDKFPAH